MTNPTKTTSLLILVILTILTVAPSVSYAAVETPEDVLRVINKVGQYMFTAFFIVAIIFIIIAAFNFLTAQGDVEKVKNARSQVLWAAVAIAVALISTGVVKIVENILE